jgi:hypothetical protein
VPGVLVVSRVLGVRVASGPVVPVVPTTVRGRLSVVAHVAVVAVAS